MTKESKHSVEQVLYLHRKPDTEEIFYVGIGSHGRAYDFQRGGRNYLWNRIVDKCGKPKVELYKTGLNYIEAQYLEKFFISKLGRIVGGTGVLANLSEGGEGGLGLKRSKESVEKRLATAKANGVVWGAKPGEKHFMYGRKLSQDHKEKLLACAKAPKSEDWKLQMSKRRKGVPQKPESVAKMRTSLTGRKLTDEVKKKLGEASRKKWQENPHWRDELRDRLKGKATNKRKILDRNTGIVYDTLKEAAKALGINSGYFNGMMSGCFTNKTNCTYLTERN